MGAIAKRLPDLGVRPEEFGAVGDGAVDDAAAIQAAIDAAGDGGVVQFAPRKNYRINSTLTVAHDWQTWYMQGATLTRHGNGVAVRIGVINPASGTDKVWHFTGHGGRIFRNAIDYTAGNVGIQFLNTNNAEWHGFHVEGFEKGIELRGDGGTGNVFIGTQYSTLRPEWIVNCKFPIYIYAINNAWSNASKWLAGGRCGYYSNQSVAGGYAVYITRDAATTAQVPNEHNFFGLTMENAVTIGAPECPTAAIYCNGQYCTWLGGRAEGFPSPKIIVNGDDAAFNNFLDIESVLKPSVDVLLPGGNNPRQIVVRAGGSTYYCGGSSTDPALVLRERSSATGTPLEIRQTDNEARIRFRADGRIAKRTSTYWGQYDGPIFTGTVTTDFGTINAGESKTVEVTPTGAGGVQSMGIRGNPVSVGATPFVDGISYTAQVKTDFGAVQVRARNDTGSPVAVGSVTLNVRVEQFAIG